MIFSYFHFSAPAAPHNQNSPCSWFDLIQTGSWHSLLYSRKNVTRFEWTWIQLIELNNVRPLLPHAFDQIQRLEKATAQARRNAQAVNSSRSFSSYQWYCIEASMSTKQHLAWLLRHWTKIIPAFLIAIGPKFSKHKNTWQWNQYA